MNLNCSHIYVNVYVVGSNVCPEFLTLLAADRTNTLLAYLNQNDLTEYNFAKEFLNLQLHSYAYFILFEWRSSNTVAAF